MFRWHRGLFLVVFAQAIAAYIRHNLSVVPDSNRKGNQAELREIYGINHQEASAPAAGATAEDDGCAALFNMRTRVPQWESLRPCVCARPRPCLRMTHRVALPLGPGGRASPDWAPAAAHRHPPNLGMWPLPAPCLRGCFRNALTLVVRLLGGGLHDLSTYDPSSAARACACRNPIAIFSVLC